MNNNNQLRILHLSDLHICDGNVKKGLEEILALFKTLASDWEQIPQLDFEFADEARLKNIKEAVQDLKPDIICVTGDLTTFGDKASFDLVYKFLSGLRNSIDKKPKIVVTPGNHDVLCSQLLALMDNVLLNKFTQELPLGVMSYLKLSSKGKDIVKIVEVAKDFKKIREKVLKVLAMDEVSPSPDPEKLLEHYENLLKNLRDLSSNETIPSVGGHDVLCIPFNSVSLDPLWLNIGEGSAKEFIEFRAKLENANEKQGSIVLALLHHNPISSAAIVDSHLKHGYDSFPGASLYVKEMQDAGADIILYGHQHKESVCQMDFVSSRYGHLYLIGASSATAPTGGFNVIDLCDRFHGAIKHYQFSCAGRHVIYDEKPDGKTLVFERKRVEHAVTLCSRYEVRHFTREREEGLEQEREHGFKPGANDLFIVRPRGEELQTKESLHALRMVLEHPVNERVRILISDPGLFEIIDRLPEKADRERLSLIWGKTYSWKEQANTARDTLARLDEFKETLPEEIKEKLHIKKASTLVPVGAVLRKENGQQDLVFLRLLPVGVDLRRRELSLEARHNNGLSSFYIGYLEELWLMGESL